MENCPMIPNEAEFLTALRKVIAAFDTLGIEYALGGSFASSLYGEARATRDVDLIAAVAGRHAAPLVTALAPEFYADEPQITAAAMNQGSFNLIHLPTMAKVDVFVVWRTDFGRTQLARRRRRQVGQAAPLDLFVTSPEDTVLAKLDWYRQGGCASDHQWRDVLGVLKVQADALDRAYLRDWAARLNLTDLLRRALDDAGLPPEP
jgi:hypothetical protein